MKIVVASRDLSISMDIIAKIAGFFSVTDENEPFAFRAPHGKDFPVSPVEGLTWQTAHSLKHPVIMFTPTRGGREAVFRRDYEMMVDATGVLAFFSPEREMEGGTGHVVKAALDRGVPVEAYSVRPDGTLVYLGSDDGDPSRSIGSGPNEVLRRMWEGAQE